MERTERDFQSPSQFFNLHVPSSTDFPILLLNQPIDKLAHTKKEGCIKFLGLGKGRYLLFFLSI